MLLAEYKKEDGAAREETGSTALANRHRSVDRFFGRLLWTWGRTDGEDDILDHLCDEPVLGFNSNLMSVQRLCKT